MSLFSKDKYFWNSGIFMFTAKMYLQELLKFEPQLAEDVLLSCQYAEKINGVIHLHLEHFSKCKNISMDYAVMEQTSNAVLIPLDVSWVDIGEWGAMCQISDRDDFGNATQGKVTLEQSRNCYVYSDDDISTIVVGMENAIIVSVKDTVLVLNKKLAKQAPSLLKNLRYRLQAKPLSC
jgi:mannose-1-phosphate guanylyltransferase